MFAFVTGNWRRKAGAILVTLYALCLVAPAAALAATEQPISAHCLGEHHHGAGAADIADHDHTGTTQDQPGHDGHGQQEKCCGLFGVTALAPEFSVVTAQITPSADIVLPRSESLLGSGVERIDRPPRVLLSL
jgi:hypothetical protein